MSDADFSVIAGAAPLLLVAPHGGRRDPAARPWRESGLKVNDLHTATLTRELAAATGAAALVNDALDRNTTDLNRIAETAERAPRFLELLAMLLARALAVHERVTLLTVHGWNVVQASVDVGLGCRPDVDPLAVGPGAAISPAFAAGGLAGFLAACAGRGIVATVGARYPARNAENLLQLFTRRYRDDPRDAVRALAALAPRVNAMQLELGIPLRWPGAWRERLQAAIVECLPALLAGETPTPASPGRAPTSVPEPPPPCRIDFTSAALCGLAALDGGPGGGRLLLFLPGGRLVLFTGERAGSAAADGIAPLAVQTGPNGTSVRFRGPLLEFPDTTPFLDLESGLARGRLVEAEVALDYRADGPLGAEGFGRVAGRVVLDGRTVDVAGFGCAGGAFAEGPWPRLRVALRLGEDTALRAVLALEDGSATGILSRGDTRLAVISGEASLAAPETPLARFELRVALENGERLALVAHAVHQLPVVRLRGTRPLRLEFAACRLEGQDSPAGWCEVGI